MRRKERAPATHYPVLRTVAASDAELGLVVAVARGIERGGDLPFNHCTIVGITLLKKTSIDGCVPGASPKSVLHRSDHSRTPVRGSKSQVPMLPASTASRRRSSASRHAGTSSLPSCRLLSCRRCWLPAGEALCPRRFVAQVVIESGHENVDTGSRKDPTAERWRACARGGRCEGYVPQYRAAAGGDNDPGGARSHNLWLKRPLLYQLSYRVGRVNLHSPGRLRFTPRDSLVLDVLRIGSAASHPRRWTGACRSCRTA